LIFILSFIIPFVPCEKISVSAALTGDLSGTWSVCPLNPLTLMFAAGSRHDYFGIAGLEMVMFLLSIILAYVLACFISKKKKK